MYRLHSVHCTKCTLYKVYTVQSVHCTKCPVYTSCRKKIPGYDLNKSSLQPKGRPIKSTIFNLIGNTKSHQHVLGILCHHLLIIVQSWQTMWSIWAHIYLTGKCCIVYSAQRIYISDTVEVTAPAIVLQRCDSPNLFPLCLQYTQLPDRLPEQAWRGWVSHIFVRRWPVPSLLSLIYILWIKHTGCAHINFVMCVL